MALRAWLSSRLNALIGTSSHTGRTATVERLLAGLVTSALVVILGRLRAEPRRKDQTVCKYSMLKHISMFRCTKKCSLTWPHRRTARGPAAGFQESFGLTSESASSPPEQTSDINTFSAAHTSTTRSRCRYWPEDTAFWCYWAFPRAAWPALCLSQRGQWWLSAAWSKPPPEV